MQYSSYITDYRHRKTNHKQTYEYTTKNDINTLTNQHPMWPAHRTQRVPEMDKRHSSASIQSQPQETTHSESIMHGAAERLLAITNRHRPNNTNTHSYKASTYKIYSICVYNCLCTYTLLLDKMKRTYRTRLFSIRTQLHVCRL
ncbi:uncharacterized protein DC041_0004124 [Schistosoma bovis]|uniref:Uncharacterized protein n=1 Tax=Schistosoma bovis TaxID=6184 RepID=A0A430Q8G2_SCHBO|nr:uncharacterized protein DC041_0004120 [Schistosoma bovis]RTG83955.1 uncharacterized protein DC041_0004119 [Schistosoma bovis]RTG83957.1 uncharacterized protein DC041_0004122 [Schistosoma bovis]RTG83958.1 uncharacterized protein DC041_0004124 [Schistosoma bovis]